MDIVGAIIHIIAILMFLASGMLMEIVRYFHKHLDDSDSDTPAFYRAIGVVGTILLILCGYSLKWKMGANTHTDHPGATMEPCLWIITGFILAIIMRRKSKPSGSST